MQNWFNSIRANSAALPSNRNRDAKRRQPNPISDTVHQGTYRPKNEIERVALQATVKLKIDDPQGSSFATGTVIHSVNGEALVLTCGHVFRDSEGTGEISAEYGFTDTETKIATGELLFYDAGARDIGLVAISTKHTIQPVPLAMANFPVNRSAEIFTIGCDQGERPSIRRSKVKNQAKYDGIKKYEIFGRPVNGRSGGGMFTADGKLVGVCNAAVVDVDEGVYVALDTIHWQLEKVNLAHLFANPSTSLVAANQVNLAISPRLAQADATVTPRDLAAIPVRSIQPRTGTRLNQTPVSNGNASLTSEASTELILVLRNADRNGSTESWTLSNPSPKLLGQLKSMSEQNSDRNSQDQRIARLRRDMPILPQATGKIYQQARMRAQSPR